MKGASKFVVSIGAFLLIGAAIILYRVNSLPPYHGESLGYWLQRLRKKEDGVINQQARDAVREAGPKAERINLITERGCVADQPQQREYARVPKFSHRFE